MWEYQCSCCDHTESGFKTFFDAQERWESHMFYDHEAEFIKSDDE